MDRWKIDKNILIYSIIFLKIDYFIYRLKIFLIKYHKVFVQNKLWDVLLMVKCLQL